MAIEKGEPLAIIAGSGSVPLHVAAVASAEGRPVFVLGFEGEADKGIEAFDHAWLNWGQVGSVGKMVRSRGARQVVLVGGIKVRPDFTRLKLDLATLRVAKEIFSIVVGGDNNVLIGAIRFLERQGLQVIGAHEVAADLVAAPGLVGSVRPNAASRDDIRVALQAAEAIGRLDAGQAAVVVNGHVIALEGAEGTDSMLDRVRTIRENKRVSWRGSAGVLAKCAKPQQDLRVDMPTIGPRTVEGAVAAGLAGIAIEPGRVMIFDREETVRRANAAGLFIIGAADAGFLAVTDRGVADRVLSVYLVAGEELGNQRLGAGLMGSLSDRLDGRVAFAGIGGTRMAALGLSSLFPISELSHAGLTAIIAHIPQILRRMRDAVEDIVRTRPDVLVVIDSPDFNLRVARRVHARLPSLPIVDYGSPTVWAWRSGRARWMAQFIDHVLALLPFEPEAHRALGGPPCTYVGHPLIERIALLRPRDGERVPLAAVDRPVLLALPGSRRSEIARHLAPFGETIGMVADRIGPVEVLLPAVPHLVAEIGEGVSDWPVQPTIVEGEEAKFAAFRRARAALAASGTVTLELALSGVPMVVGYRADALISLLHPFLRVKSVVLSNLILGTNVIPEFIARDFKPELLAGALEPLLRDTPERAAQLAAFERLDQAMSLGNVTPTAKAAEVIMTVVAGRAR